MISDEDIEREVRSSVPQKTTKQTSWCFGVWKLWRESRLESKDVRDHPPELLSMSDDDLCKWMIKFLYEARKKADGSEYRGETLYQLLCGIQRYLRANGRPDIIDFLSDSKFRPLKDVLDAKMKSLTRAGIGLERNKAEPITIEEEESLWRKGLLGDTSPDVLRDTIVYMCGLYFALRGGTELCGLKVQQITVHKLPNSDEYLKYHETGSKNNPGGLHHRKFESKVVPHYSNKENPSRCFVQLFKKYLSKCPPNPPDGALFLQSLVRPTCDRWYANRVVGHNLLGSTVKRLCSNAGITGHKSNHSLRATAATRLFHHGVDEQMIMKVTGHRSLDGVRSYKRPSLEQFKHVSEVLHGGETEAESKGVTPVTKTPSPVKYVLTSAAEKNKSDILSGHGICFNNCNNIHINIS